MMVNRRNFVTTVGKLGLFTIIGGAILSSCTKDIRYESSNKKVMQDTRYKTLAGIYWVVDDTVSVTNNTDSCYVKKLIKVFRSNGYLNKKSERRIKVGGFAKESSNTENRIYQVVAYDKPLLLKRTAGLLKKEEQFLVPLIIKEKESLKMLSLHNNFI